MKALGGGGKRLDALGLQCAEKATMIVVLSWLAGGGGLSKERLRLRWWWWWPKRYSGKAARVMQESAVSWEARERKVPCPCPGCVGSVSVCWWTTEGDQGPGQKQS
jgi:hypothetical protein